MNLKELADLATVRNLLVLMESNSSLVHSKDRKPINEKIKELNACFLENVLSLNLKEPASEIKKQIAVTEKPSAQIPPAKKPSVAKKKAPRKTPKTPEEMEAIKKAKMSEDVVLEKGKKPGTSKVIDDIKKDRKKDIPENGFVRV